MSRAVAAAIGSAPPRVLALTWVPLDRAALCLDCEAVYLRADACPHCASRSWTPLQRFLTERHAGGVPEVPDRLVSFRAVEDRLANGLVPARLFAEQVIATLIMLTEIGGSWTRAVHAEALAEAQALLCALDQTLAQVRAL